MDIYKIGLKNYQNKEDKNSGLFEYSLISSEIESLDYDDTLLILNGKFVGNEEEYLLEMMKDYKYCIFVASDIVAFEDNKNIIKECQWLLHQAIAPNAFDEYLKNSKLVGSSYSAVPELFYKFHKTREHTNIKDNKLFFGGGCRGNDDVIAKYLNSVDSASLLKTDTSDVRLPYFDYLQEMSKHKYCLIISRKQYQKVGWITARYYEAIAYGCVPIIDNNYDSNNYLFAEHLKCTPSTVKDLINKLNGNEQFVVGFLQKTADVRSNDFTTNLIQIMEKLYDSNN